MKPRAVYGENVQDTMTFAKSGNADVAIIALSLATTAPGRYVAIDPELHDSVVNDKDVRAVVMKGREYRGYVHVDDAAVRSKKDLDRWVSMALDENARLARATR